MKKTGIGLIYPNSNLKGIPRQFRYMPLGLMQIASVLREKGYNVKIIDANNEDISLDEILYFVLQNRFEYVGVSATTTLISSAYETINYLKNNIDYDIKIILGGIHGTALPTEVLENSRTDYVVIGEGDETIVELMDVLESRNEPRSVKGIAYRDKNSQLVITERRNLIQDIDKLSIPAYDLINIDNYASITSNTNRFVTYIRSRGCPYNCTFCSVNSMFYRRYRVQSPNRTVSDLIFLKKKFGIEEVLFKDSEFIIDRKNSLELFKKMIENNLEIKWSCSARVDSVDIELLRFMKKAGCKVISYGIESGSPAVLKRLNKQITIDQVKNALRLTKEVGIKIAVSFIIGHDHETLAELNETYNFIKSIDYNYISVSFLTPFPGSELYDSRFDTKEKFTGNYDKLEELGNLSVNLTDSIDDKTLINMRKKIYFRSYFRIKFLKTVFSNINIVTLKKYIRFFFILLKELIKNKFRKASNYE